MNGTPWARPAPRPLHPHPTVHGGTPLPEVVDALLAGKARRLVGTYGAGATILDALHVRIVHGVDASDHHARRAATRRFRAAAEHLLVEVRDHRVTLAGVGTIGFLDELYPELPTFLLPLVAVQSLYGAWQTYVEGVSMPVIGGALHPFYGTYAPTRTEHLELFGTWLRAQDPPPACAVDVGTGSGVLAFMLLRAGVPSVWAVDQNANAVESVRRDAGRRGVLDALTLGVGDLLDPVDAQPDLIVFNPPWMEGEPDGDVEAALYRDAALIPRFLEQAKGTLASGGRVVLVYSNIATLVQPDRPHPIEAAIDAGAWTLVTKPTRRVKGRRLADGRRARTKERVELWVLAPTS